MTRPDHFIDDGEATCAWCSIGFTTERRPHEVTRVRREVTGNYGYREDAPWHAECIVEANTEADAAEPDQVAVRHQAHYTACNCLDDSAECCDPSCPCKEPKP